MHTPLNQCTSDCRRIGCPEDPSYRQNEKLSFAGAKEFINKFNKACYGIEPYKAEHRVEVETGICSCGKQHDTD